MIYIYIDIYIHYIDTGTDNIASFMQVSYGRTTFAVVRTTSVPQLNPQFHHSEPMKEMLKTQ